MDFHSKLPRDRRAFILFIAVVSVISVNIIAPRIFAIAFAVEALMAHFVTVRVHRFKDANEGR